MSGPEVLSARLASWADGEGLTQQWIRGSLRLQSQTGSLKSIISFDPDFWRQFQRTAPAEREGVLEALCRSVVLQCRPALDTIARTIDVPLLCLAGGNAPRSLAAAQP